MDKNKDTLAGTQVFKLAPGDVDHLFRRSGLAGNILSPFRYNKERAATGSPSEWFKALAESTFFPQTARHLLEPQHKILFRRGGAMSSNEEYYLFLSPQGGTVLAQFTNFEGDLMLLLFPNGDAFWQWWGETNASDGMNDYQSPFTNALELEVLVCAFHCLDIYRRFFMEGMLEYRRAVDISITSQNFIQLMKRALVSKDTRWLLPTLLEITPGLKGNKIALKPEHLKKLEELGFLTKDEKMLLTMAERGRIMGTEFLTTWMGAFAWQASTLINGEEKGISQMFMAPTSFTNHFISFETGEAGSLRFHHQALGRAELIKTLQQGMKTISQKAPAYSDDSEKVSKPPGGNKQAKFCTQCGNKLIPNKKFCSNCGAPV